MRAIGLGKQARVKCYESTEEEVEGNWEGLWNS